MKRTKLFSLLCLGVILGGTACSDDDDDEKKDSVVVKPVNEYDADDLKETEKYRFYGAELFTNETFKYGKFEAKMKMAYAPGCISSMFLYYNDSYKGNGEVWNEIDIEVIGKEPNGFQSNIITGKAEGQITTEKIHDLNTPISNDFHIYTIEWTPEYVAWFVDGKEMRKTDSSNDSKKQVAALVKEESLRFNLWSSEAVEWVDHLYQKNIPISQEIDYVKVYSYDENSKSFAELWTDDFDKLDTKRWGRGNWNIGQVVERPNNVVVENGILKLNLTKELK